MSETPPSRKFIRLLPAFKNTLCVYENENANVWAFAHVLRDASWSLMLETHYHWTFEIIAKKKFETFQTISASKGLKFEKQKRKITRKSVK